jgi:hypothetical protein
MIYTTHNHYYNNLKNLKILAASKLLAHTKYWRWQNIGAYKNLGVDKILALTEHMRPQILAQEKVGGDAEELPYC